MKNHRLPIRLSAMALLILTGLCAGCLGADFRSPAVTDQFQELADDTFYDTGLPAPFDPMIPKTPARRLCPAKGVLELSVEDAVFLALTRNRDLQIQQIEPAIAGTFEQIERGQYDPELVARIEFEREIEAQDSDTAATVFAGVRQALPTGTRWEAGATIQRDTSEPGNEDSHTRLGLTVTQALLRGAGPRISLAKIRQRELDTLASIHELAGFCQALVAETEIAYWNYILAQKEIAIYTHSLTIARQQKNEVEQQIMVGLLPENEAAAARAEEAVHEQELINARNVLEERRLKLLLLIGDSSDNPLDMAIKATSDPVIDTVPVTNRDERIRLAIKNRPDLGEARLRLARGRLETMMTKNGMLPKIDLFIDLGINGYGRRIASSLPDISGEGVDMGVGLQLSHYPGTRTETARHRSARLTRQRAEAALRNLETAVMFDIGIAVNEVERSRQQILASKTTRLFEEKTLESELERFNVGKGTALMVAKAQRDLLSSRIAEVRAVVSYRTALVQLYLSEGSLLQRRGIIFPEPGSE